MVPLPEMQEEADVTLIKVCAGAAVAVGAVALALSLGLLLMGEVAQLVHWMIKG